MISPQPIRTALILTAFALVLGPMLARGAETALPQLAAPEDARAYIISPADGARVTSPVTVRFGLTGMGVVPAGIAYEGAGHHHLIVDAVLPPTDQPIPSDARHRHFGKGQTEVSLELAPGPHTLQILLGDQNHVPHRPPVVSKRVRITVEAQ